jgi:hypothetical protein
VCEIYTRAVITSKPKLNIHKRKIYTYIYIYKKLLNKGGISERKKKGKTMKMKLGIIWCYLLFVLINYKNSYYASAKSVETQNLASCHEHVSEFFKSFLNITIEPSEKIGKC